MAKIYNYGKDVRSQGRPIELDKTLSLTKHQLQAGEQVSAILILGSSDFALLVRTDEEFATVEEKKSEGRLTGLFAISSELASKAAPI